MGNVSVYSRVFRGPLSNGNGLGSPRALKSTQKQGGAGEARGRRGGGAGRRGEARGGAGFVGGISDLPLGGKGKINRNFSVLFFIFVYKRKNSPR